MKNNDFAELNALIEERISEMESDNYEFPQRFSKTDYIITTVVVLFCLAFVIGGAYLA